MININDIYWAAGFMEGEGSFYKSCNKRGSLVFNVSAEQTTLEPLERLSNLFGGNMSTRYNDRYTDGKLYRWYCNGARAAGIAMTLYSLMTKKRKLQIVNSLGVWLKTPIRNGLKTHCKHGHEYTKENTYVRPRRQRECRKCIRERKRGVIWQIQ